MAPLDPFVKKKGMSEEEAVRKNVQPSGAGQAAAAAKKAQEQRKKDTDDMLKQLGSTPASPRVYKKGGKVKKTGVAKVHKGEVVLTEKQAKKLPRSMGGKGMGGGGPVGGKCPKTGEPRKRPAMGKGKGPRK